MDTILHYLMQGHGEWTRQFGSNVPIKFNQAIMFSMAKMWVQFIYTPILPTQNVSYITAF